MFEEFAVGAISELFFFSIFLFLNFDVQNHKQIPKFPITSLNVR
jgi:hypothetical protein